MFRPIFKQRHFFCSFSCCPRVGMDETEPIMTESKILLKNQQIPTLPTYTRIVLAENVDRHYCYENFLRLYSVDAIIARQQVPYRTYLCCSCTYIRRFLRTREYTLFGVKIHHSVVVVVFSSLTHTRIIGFVSRVQRHVLLEYDLPTATEQVGIGPIRYTYHDSYVFV